MASAELSGVSIVAAGSFNPAIVHPSWLASKEFIPENAAEHAMRPDASQQMIVTPQIAVFVADWLSVQVTQEQAAFSTVDEGREADLRDLVINIFESLPETPVDGVGINGDTHFKVESEDAWHAFGDRFLPKDFWEPIFADGAWRRRGDDHAVGMRTMVVEVHRADEAIPGYVRVEVAPSVRVGPYGVYVGINGHLQLTLPNDGRRTAADAAEAIRENWDSIREREGKLLAQLGEAI